MNTSRYLHEEIELVKDDPKFSDKILRIIDLQSQTNRLTPI
jgi:hypothetical protein